MAGTENSIKQGFNLADFDYELPAELIAQEPQAVRHESRLLLVNKNGTAISHQRFSQIGESLHAGDLLVLNDTRVIPAHVEARRQTGGAVELLLLRPLAQRPGVWEAMATPLKKLKVGERLKVYRDGQTTDAELVVQDFIEAEDGTRRVLIDLGGAGGSFELLSGIGSAPLPPYVQRKSTEAPQRLHDLDRYQTVYARAPGAVAAPTAGLHFSNELLSELQSKGVQLAWVTLHVGPGTFKPITTSIDEHSIESEEFVISQETADLVNTARRQGRRVIAVGTTSCRALETAGQSGELRAVTGERSSLYITPGFQFKILSGLITNFHLPRSSLLLLVSAFAGYDLMRASYSEAVRERYRFFSYGDAMAIL